MKIRITTRALGHNRVAIMTYNGNGQPMEWVFVGPWSQALRERNRRCAKWSQSASSVEAEGMPVHWS